MERIWELNDPGKVGVSSGQVYSFLLGYPDSRSRAAVVFFLNDMVEEGVLKYEEETGKGGYHRVHYPKMEREPFARHVVEKIMDKLSEVFPEV